MAEEVKRQSTLADLIQLGAGLYFTDRAIKYGTVTGQGTLPSDHPHVATGVDSNGDTLVAKQIVSGVSNAALLTGVAGVLVIGAVVAALVFD